MGMNDMLLAELGQETANTRRILERVPEDKFDWAPHPKSMQLGRLASHLSELPQWGTNTLTLDELDILPAGVQSFVAANYKTRQAILDAFDKNVAELRAALAKTPDDHFGKPWSLKKAGVTLVTMPKMAILRGMVLNHTIHHRAQLGVYLRIAGIPVPPTYGPTADEGTM